MSTIPTLDLTCGSSGVKVQIPAPNDIVPDLSFAGITPSCSWRIMTGESDLIGHLGLYGLGPGEKLLLTLYGRNAGLIAAWTTCVSEIHARPITWAIPGLVAVGKITTISGEPGLGKSLLMAEFAACVSAGRRLFPGHDPSVTGGVVIVSLEDDHHNTLKPRLLAAEACEGRIHVMSGAHASADIEAILENVDQLPDTKLLIVDPISACLGGRDLNRASDMRALLMLVTAWAEERGVGVVLVNHLNKATGGRSPLSRMRGSEAIAAVVRSAYMVCSDPEDAERRLLLRAKDNIGSSRQGLVFRIAETTLPDGITSAKVIFDAAKTDISAREALAAQNASPRATTAVREAILFLQDYLLAGEQSAGAVNEAADAHGISPASLRRARAALGIKPRKAGMSEGWVWALPPPVMGRTTACAPKMSSSPEDAHAASLVTFESEPFSTADDVGRKEPAVTSVGES